MRVGMLTTTVADLCDLSTLVNVWPAIIRLAPKP
jgi:hypothetical protein